MSTRKPKIKSNKTGQTSNSKLGYGETSKNVSTLRKIEKAISDEKEINQIDDIIHLNINNYVIIFPTVEGTKKIAEILRKKYNTSTTLIDELMKKRLTKDGGYKDQLWHIMSELGEIFFNGSHYLESSNMIIEKKHL